MVPSWPSYLRQRRYLRRSSRGWEGVGPPPPPRFARSPSPVARGRVWSEALEVAGDQGAVEAGEVADVALGGVLVDPVHGGAHQAQLDHRAQPGDEAGVRGAAGGGELGLAAQGLAAGVRNQLHE